MFSSPDSQSVRKRQGTSASPSVEDFELGRRSGTASPPEYGYNTSHDLDQAVQAICLGRYQRVRLRVRRSILFVTAGVLMLWRPLQLLATELPSFLPKMVLLAGLVSIAIKLVQFHRWNDELKHLKSFVIVFLCLVAELFVENILVWGVAFTDERKYDKSVKGLQDNVAIVLGWLGDYSPLIRSLMMYQWTHTMNQLLLVLGLAFSVLWDQVPFSGFGMMTRYILAMVLARVLRAVCFMAVVLPHPQGYGCYPRRFPPPPTTAWGFLKVGMSKLKGTGGCNDLVLSGHGIVWVLTPLIFQSYVRNRYLSSLLWAAYIQTSLRTALEKQHYSVDMILAGVCTTLVYYQVERIYPEYNLLPERLRSQASDKLNMWVMLPIAVSLTVVAILLFVAKA